MLARMMLFGSNVLVIDQPTNHLDLESITAVNNGVRDFKGTVLFASHDHEFVQTIATRIIEIREKGVLDKECTYDEFLEFRETYKADAGALSARSERPARAADTGCVGICLGAAVRLELSDQILDRRAVSRLRAEPRTCRSAPTGLRTALRFHPMVFVLPLVVCTRCLVKAAFGSKTSSACCCGALSCWISQLADTSRAA